MKHTKIDIIFRLLKDGNNSYKWRRQVSKSFLGFGIFVPVCFLGCSCFQCSYHILPLQIDKSGGIKRKIEGQPVFLYRYKGQEMIRFYTPNTPYFEFSNFYTGNVPICIDGLDYTNVEQWFQSQKFVGTGPRGDEYAEIIRNADSPQKVKMLGSQRKLSRFGTNWVVNKNTDPRLVFDLIDEYQDCIIREDWNDVREYVMKKGLLAKFSQDETLRRLLLDTQDAELVEDSPKDYYWGCGRDGNGKNRLGALLMQVREELRNDVA